MCSVLKFITGSEEETKSRLFISDERTSNTKYLFTNVRDKFGT